ncbi:MAG: T9SS type A sorting domain-containing protein, partial [bacterium]
YWVNETQGAQKMYTKDTLVEFYVSSPSSLFHVCIDSAGYKSKKDTVKITMTPQFDAQPEYRYDVLSLTSKINTYNYKWYKNSILLDGENTYEIPYREKYGTGNYYVEYSGGCEGTIEFGEVGFSQPTTAQDVQHCGNESVSFLAAPKHNSVKYQWYSPDTTYLGTSEDDTFEANVQGSGTYFVAVDSMNNISEITPFNVLINYKPIVSLHIEDDYIYVVDTSGNELYYEWFIDGKKVDSLSNKSQINIPNSNDVKVIVSTEFCDTEIKVPLDIQKYSIVKTDDFIVYPNPASNTLNIKSSNGAVGYSYHLINVTGQVVMKDSVHENLKSLDVSSLTPGVYLININHGRSNFNYKFIKQ